VALNLLDLSQRLENTEPFIRSLFRELQDGCLNILRTWTPGKRLPYEWTADQTISGNAGTLRIFNERLESDRGHWELIFKWLNEGTRAHPVAPVRAKALHWIDENTGEDRFSMGHDVEGIQASYFAERVDRLLDDFDQKLGGKWKRWIETGHYS
jgi:hypothetical protein